MTSCWHLQMLLKLVLHNEICGRTTVQQNETSQGAFSSASSALPPPPPQRSLTISLFLSLSLSLCLSLSLSLPPSLSRSRALLSSLTHALVLHFSKSLTPHPHWTLSSFTAFLISRSGCQNQCFFVVGLHVKVLSYSSLYQLIGSLLRILLLSK